MKMKKLMSLVMACAMALALASTALALETDLDHSTTLEGVTQRMTISLTVDSTVNKIVFNPYRIEVKTATSGDLDASNGTAAGNDQIIAKTLCITNKTNVPLKLTATFAMAVEAATGDTAAEIAKAAPAATATAKQIYMYADFAVFDKKGNDNKGIEPGADRPEAWLTASRLVGTAGTQGTDGWTGGTKHAATGIVNIPATDNTATGANFIYVKFGGSATVAPTIPWKDTDKVTVGLVYNFAPQASYDKYRIVATKPDASSATVYFGDSDPTPTFTVSYQNANLVVAEGGNTVEAKKTWYGTDDKVIAGNVLGGFQILIHCPEDSANAGKYFPITAVTFKNQDGTTNTAVKATKLDTKNELSDWAFTMPSQNIQCLLTVGTTSK